MPTGHPAAVVVPERIDPSIRVGGQPPESMSPVPSGREQRNAQITCSSHPSTGPSANQLARLLGKQGDQLASVWRIDSRRLRSTSKSTYPTRLLGRQFVDGSSTLRPLPDLT